MAWNNRCTSKISDAAGQKTMACFLQSALHRGTRPLYTKTGLRDLYPARMQLSTVAAAANMYVFAVINTRFACFELVNGHMYVLVFESVKGHSLFVAADVPNAFAIGFRGITMRWDVVSSFPHMHIITVSLARH